ncbi:DsrE family protein [Arenicella xantha]|uniref:Intracellular sulfur oxidation DsrE/DsrF family protein n=1 Tax=Arenicella xantha TaxID=644221 RepID=A0A395JIP2_9GAMM|nr:DsrE family protein [Arenicella xantha]RBP48490.1 intracellular sulfur oxidation DsrE/DsrF family protein [Arenicella xantha]
MRYLGFICLLLTCLNSAVASEKSFSKGPVFSEYGENVVIDDGLPDAQKQHFKVVFDVAKGAEEGAVNRQFNSVARFINMHVRAGVPKENIDVALVVHGKASFDVLRDSEFNDKFERPNASADLVAKLMANGVTVYLCGQSASHLGVEKKSLIDGVHMSLSAMTANALLQQQGYTLNPF